MDAFNISNDLMKTTFSARLESTPVVRRLRQGTFVTKEDVYAQAALHARAARVVQTKMHSWGVFH